MLGKLRGFTKRSFTYDSALMLMDKMLAPLISDIIESKQLSDTVVIAYDEPLKRIQKSGWTGKYIYIEHGLGAMKYYTYKYEFFHHADLLFYPGEVFKRKMSVINPTFKNGLLGGYPKIDDLLSMQIDRKALLEKYKLKKVAIIDFDVHHGNGTQDIFYDNEKVLYISSHQYPYYPGTGAANEKGNKDNVLNVPLNAGTQSHEFLNAYDSIFKKLKEFKPEFILLSAGFDAHKDDPLAQINLESKDYYTLTTRILTLAKALCDGKVVSILEGGYDLNALKESVDYHVKSLLESQ